MRKGATAIFDDAISYIADNIKKSVAKAKAHEKRTRITVFSVLTVICIVISLVSVGAKVAYKVNYAGKYIATVRNKAQFLSAAETVRGLIVSDNTENAVAVPLYAATLTFDSGIDDDETVVNAIIKNSNNICKASSVEVDGEQVACIEKKQFDSYLDERYKATAPEGTTGTTEFVDGNVSVSEGLYLKSDVMDIMSVKPMLSSLAVKAVVTVESDIETSYKTVNKVDSNKAIGYRRIETEGKKGINHVVDNVTYMNGEEISRERISETVIAEPVSCVVVIGNAITKVKSKGGVTAASAGFVFPLPKGKWKFNAGYGDGRGHKGVDLGCDKGTQIFAVKDGVVTKAGWYSSYGYRVVINHGNGLSTLYAHASTLCVSEGEHVKAGDVIALAGRTGNASGDHLHFEVISGNKNLNPAPYIGL